MSKVTIYTRQLCGYCTAARKLLDSKNAKVEERDATFDPDLRQEMISRSGGASTFPQIFVGNVHVGGCDDLFALDRSGGLDKLITGGTES